MIRDPFHARELLAFLLLCAVALACTRCHPQTPAEAEAAYTAEQLACVADGHRKGQPLSEVHACRAESDIRWGKTPRRAP